MLEYFAGKNHVVYVNVKEHVEHMNLSVHLILVETQSCGSVRNTMQVYLSIISFKS